MKTENKRVDVPWKNCQTAMDTAENIYNSTLKSALATYGYALDYAVRMYVTALKSEGDTK